MKNLNSIISRLSRSSLMSRTARGSSKRSLSRAVTDTIIGTAIGKVGPKPSQGPLQTGALANVGGMAWKAYEVYSQQGYGQNTYLQKAMAISKGRLDQEMKNLQSIKIETQKLLDLKSDVLPSECNRPIV